MNQLDFNDYANAIVFEYKRRGWFDEPVQGFVKELEDAYKAIGFSFMRHERHQLIGEALKAAAVLHRKCTPLGLKLNEMRPRKRYTNKVKALFEKLKTADDFRYEYAAVVEELIAITLSYIDSDLEKATTILSQVYEDLITPVRFSDNGSVGDYLKFLREARGMTQEEVAQIYGRSVRCLRTWENGYQAPAMKEVVGLTEDVYKVPFGKALNEYTDEKLKDAA